VERAYCVYILTNQHNKVLYTGVTGDLQKRVYQDREELLLGFTNRYNVFKLVYYVAGYDAAGAIAREKQIKAGSRRRKNRPLSTDSTQDGATYARNCDREYDCFVAMRLAMTGSGVIASQ
jgi:putative endonuclease